MFAGTIKKTKVTLFIQSLLRFCMERNPMKNEKYRKNWRYQKKSKVLTRKNDRKNKETLVKTIFMAVLILFKSGQRQKTGQLDQEHKFSNKRLQKKNHVSDWWCITKNYSKSE